MTKIKLAIAILINLFVMPGLGQMYVGRKARGMVFVGLMFFVLLVLAVHIVSSVSAEVGKLQNEPMDMVRMAQSISAMGQGLLGTNSLVLRVYFFILGVGYILSVADLFWLYYDTAQRPRT